ncbi:DUF4352 domain-containing protein [Streptomyces sp. NPDC059534]|uniref:DUF4352 domain-containing protein n=1 Tax=Streptomyces sp. NPDC059534 TaxID=3346859 RepID=UPI0036BD627B
MGAGAIVAIVLGSIFGLFLLLVVIVAVTGDDTKGNAGSDSKRPATAAPTPKGSAAAPTSEAPQEEPAADAPVKVTAKPVAFKPSVLHDGGKYTSVEVTITNTGTETISTNPLWFSITDTSGTKHAAELGEDDNQIDLLKLEPGEKATGVITGKGAFIPKYVTYRVGFSGESVRGNVS